jgi:hypothetical protein
MDINATIDWDTLVYEPPKDENYYNSFRSVQNYQL